MNEIDRAVWAAHLREDLAIVQPVDPAALEAWGEEIRVEARAYWHGTSGCLADRLEICDGEWLAMVRIHSPEPAACIGDSSHDLVGEILRRAGV